MKIHEYQAKAILQQHRIEKLLVVNEDGDKPEKREFCAARGLRYTVLQRVPHEGLPARSSTDLRGF